MRWVLNGCHYTEDTPDDGFAFRACRWDQSSACIFPLEVGGGVVESKKKYTNSTWDEMPRDSPLKEWASDEYAQLTAFDHGKAVISSNTKMNIHGWYVWKKEVPLQQPYDKPFLGGGDKILVTCHYSYGIPNPIESSPFSCDRFFVGENYRLKYDFKPKDKAPSVQYIENLDKQVTKVVDSWRCEG